MATAPDEISGLLNQVTLQRLDASVSGLDREQLVWASGYLAGLGRAANGTVAPEHPALLLAATDSPQQDAWTVLYATETGNSRDIATALAAQAEAAGITTRLVDLHDFPPRKLRRERNVLFVTATHGLGDPPEGSEDFFSYWLADDAPRLPELRYSVLALGDSSYEDFCAIGRQLDERLAALGAQRLSERVECDLDFEYPASTWTTTVLEQATAAGNSGTAAAAAATRETPRVVSMPGASWSRARPYAAEILVDQKITGNGSSKDVRHFELATEDAALRWQPGDALGVVPENPPQLVEELLQLTGLAADAPVTVQDEELSLALALRTRLEITAASRAFVNAWSVDNPALAAATGGKQAGELQSWLERHQVIDIVAAFPRATSPQDFAAALRGLTPRLYSIASSHDADPDSLHLTVRVVDYTAHGRHHLGAASSFLAAAPERVPVYIAANERFRLPADPDTPLIMIGPGTGVAPFRAFLQQRESDGAKGRNWLFFGDRTRRDDFLYQIDWLRWWRDGLLSRLDTAFSREQADKIYVQDRIAAQADALHGWLEDGAHLYVCGDALQMAPAVHAALRQAIATARGCDEETAETSLQQLRQAGRYQRDVY